MTGPKQKAQLSKTLFFKEFMRKAFVKRKILWRLKNKILHSPPFPINWPHSFPILTSPSPSWWQPIQCNTTLSHFWLLKGDIEKSLKIGHVSNQNQLFLGTQKWVRLKEETEKDKSSKYHYLNFVFRDGFPAITLKIVFG